MLSPHCPWCSRRENTDGSRRSWRKKLKLRRIEASSVRQDLFPFSFIFFFLFFLFFFFFFFFFFCNATARNPCAVAPSARFEKRFQMVWLAGEWELSCSRAAGAAESRRDSRAALRVVFS